MQKKLQNFLHEIDQSLSIDSENRLSSERASTETKKKNLNSNMSLLEACKPSLDPKSKRFNTSFSIEDAYEKLNELTNRNKYARDNLLKIQESVIELQVANFKRKKA